MELKSAEEWVEYIYEKAFFDLKGGKTEVDEEKLKELIGQIPTKFHENENIVFLKKLSDDLDEKLCGPLVQIWDMENVFTIENSILSKYSETEDKILQLAMFLCLRQAENDFGNIQGFIYELGFWKSIDELELAKIELREINRFFDSGLSNSIAINIEKDVFEKNYSAVELYQYYLSLLRGNFEFFIDKEESVKYFKELEKIRELDLLNNNSHFIKVLNHHSDLNSYFKKEWWMAARIQALLWIRTYLEKVIETENFSFYKVKLPIPSIDDLASGNEGFKVKEPDKTIPALHKSLIENNLILDEGLESFRNAFEKGQGFIIWTGGKSTHGKGVNSLIYCIDRMCRQELIINENFIKITASIFKDKEGTLFKHTSLTQSNNANTNTPPKNKKLIDSIVDNLKNL